MSSPSSHLRGHNLNTIFKTYQSAQYLWKGIETTSHYLLCQHNFSNERSTILDSIKEIGFANLTNSDSCITNIFLSDNSYLLQK